MKILMIIVLLYIYKKIEDRKDMSISTVVLVLIVSIVILFVNVAITPTVFFNPFVLMLSGIVLCYIFIKILKKLRNLFYKIDAYNDLQTLNRDIDVKYNPSITSYLTDGTIKIKDIAADIMNLYAKKIINVEKQVMENKIKYKLTLDEKAIKNNEIFTSDRYIIDTVIQKKYRFDFDTWKDLVENIFLNMGVCQKEKKQLKISAIYIILSIAFIVTFILMLYSGKDIVLAIPYSVIVVCVLGLLVLLFANTINSRAFQKIDLNAVGKEEVKKWIKFKKYIEEYTLIKDRDIEDIIIYEKYIPYAVALKINLNYDETIYSVFNNREIKEIIKDISDEGVLENYFQM